jgi:hypothetical protein
MSGSISATAAAAAPLIPPTELTKQASRLINLIREELGLNCIIKQLPSFLSGDHKKIGKMLLERPDLLNVAGYLSATSPPIQTSPFTMFVGCCRSEPLDPQILKIIRSCVQRGADPYSQIGENRSPLQLITSRMLEDKFCSPTQRQIMEVLLEAPMPAGKKSASAAAAQATAAAPASGSAPQKKPASTAAQATAAAPASGNALKKQKDAIALTALADGLSQVFANEVNDSKSNK